MTDTRPPPSQVPGVGSVASAVSAVRRRAKVRTRWNRTRKKVTQQRASSAYARARRHPVQDRTVLYESFFGNGVLDNPEAVFRHLLTQPDMQDLEHVWALDDLAKHRDAVREFAGNPRVRFVRTDSKDYWRAIATAKYLVNNQTFPQLFAKRPGQVYLNTWHGVPLKHMGLDMAGVSRNHPRNIIRNMLNADYLVSASPFMTDTMYRRAYKLQGLFPNTVLEMGQPRMDFLTAALEDPAGARRRLAGDGLDVGDRRILLFAPTWRGDNFGEPQDDALDLARTCSVLQDALGPGWAVLLKVHQSAHGKVREVLRGTDRSDLLVPNHVPTNLLLGVTDVLVTDYSSIFFDYAATSRPVVHYVPDLEQYTAERGLYLTHDQLPGPVVTDHAGLVAEVRAAIDAGPISQRARATAATYTGPADGEVTARIVDVVFRGREEAADAPGRRLVRDFVDPTKERMLLYLGSMLSQGITTSAVNLLRHLDYDKYDVTVFWPQIRGRDRSKNIALVDPRARPLPRALLYIGTRSTIKHETDVRMQVGLEEEISEEHLAFWRTERQRVFGDATFDHLVDFSGYGTYAPFLFAAMEARTRSMWLHNEMIADRDRETLGVRHLHARLTAVFTTYRHFDHLVSVSPELRDINRSGLAEFAPPEKFFYALNTIEGAHILEQAQEPYWGYATWGTPEEWEMRKLGLSQRAAEPAVQPVAQQVAQQVAQPSAQTAAEPADDLDDADEPDDRTDPETGEDPDQSAEELEESEGREEAGTQAEPRPESEAGQLREESTEPDAAGPVNTTGGYVDGRPHRLRPIKMPGWIVFVCVGRLSPAKNHARLLDSFKLVHERHPETRLWLIGGGALEDELRAQIRRLGLEDAVHMTGQVMNPYKYMAKADCFVLSSDYEGQPVVILEARVLGLPVVSTAFASVGDSIPPGAGLVVPRTVEGLAEGMERFLAGELEGRTLDYEEYNRQAVEQFEAAIHGRQK